MKPSIKRFHTFLTLAESCLIMVALACCAGQPGNETVPVQGRHFTLHLVPGPEYNFTLGWFFLSVPIYPQIACWIETPQGDYVDSLYVTSKSADKTWIMAPPGGRPEALPVWFHLKKNRPAAVDATAGPTSRGDTAHDLDLVPGLPNGTYVVKLEINRSYDYNERYTRANSGVNGQPSLIYTCTITVGEGGSKAIFVPFGTGSIDGSDGNIRPGLDGITTALQLLSDAEIFYGGVKK